MSNNNINLQKSKTDKIITIIEWYLDDLKKYRKQLDRDFVKRWNHEKTLVINYSITGKLKHLGIISRKEMIAFEKTVGTHFYKSE